MVLSNQDKIARIVEKINEFDRKGQEYQGLGDLFYVLDLFSYFFHFRFHLDDGLRDFKKRTF